MKREWRRTFHQHPDPRAKLIDQVDGVSVEFVGSRHADNKLPPHARSPEAALCLGE
jgi:hypothetical protein